MQRKWALWFAYHAAMNASKFAATQRLLNVAEAFDEVAEFIAERLREMPDPQEDTAA